MEKTKGVVKNDYSRNTGNKTQTNKTITNAHTQHKTRQKTKEMINTDPTKIYLLNKKAKSVFFHNTESFSLVDCSAIFLTRT